MKLCSLVVTMQFTLMRILRANLPKCGSAITKSFLGTALTIVYGFSILSKNYLIDFSTKSHGRRLFNLSTP